MNKLEQNLAKKFNIFKFYDEGLTKKFTERLIFLNQNYMILLLNTRDVIL